MVGEKPIRISPAFALASRTSRLSAKRLGSTFSMSLARRQLRHGSKGACFCIDINAISTFEPSFIVTAQGTSQYCEPFP